MFAKLGLVPLHSAHWSRPFVRLMQERAKADALAKLPEAERAWRELDPGAFLYVSLGGLLKSMPPLRAYTWVAILIAVALIVVAWFLSLVVRFALSRSREYLADAGSVSYMFSRKGVVIVPKGELTEAREVAGGVQTTVRLTIEREGVLESFVRVVRRDEPVVVGRVGREPGDRRDDSRGRVPVRRDRLGWFENHVLAADS